MSQLGSYAQSTALSATHYKLVQAVEQSRSPEETNAVLLACLGKIRTAWTKRAPSPATARHDLVLLLYCSTQRPDVGLEPTEEELWTCEWALPTAVMLAGGGGTGNIHDRQIGYRACAELFSPGPHPLKLLLINTIRNDLDLPAEAHKAEARWALALRAVAHPALVTAELVPAVRQGVLAMLVDSSVPDQIRRLALEAALSLVRVAHNSDHPDASLTDDVRSAVLQLVLPAPPSASTSTRYRHTSPDLSGSAMSLSFLAAISSALSTSSPLHPLLESRSERISLQLGILRDIRTADFDGHQKRHKGFKAMWATAKVLASLESELIASGGDTIADEAAKDVGVAIWRIARDALQTGNEAADATLLSCLRILALVPSATMSESSTVPALLSHLNQRLSAAQSASSLYFALRALALLPPDLWTSSPSQSLDGSASSSDASDRERAFRNILGALDHADASVRRAALVLLHRVDPHLVQLHFERTLAALRTPDEGAQGASTTSVRSGSSAGTGRKRGARERERKDRVIERVLEVLPFLPSSTSAGNEPGSASSSLPPASTLLDLLARPEVGISRTSVLPSLVLPVLASFQYAPPDAQQSFACEFIADAAGRWKESVVAGLWVAGVMHVLRENDAYKAAKALVDFLAGPTADDLLSLSQEPLLFAFLRLLACNPSLFGDAELSTRLYGASSRSASPEASRLFRLADELCTSPAPGQRQALLRAGEQHSTRSLAEFGVALLEAFETQPTAHDLAAAAPVSAASSRLYQPLTSKFSPVRHAHRLSSSTSSPPSSQPAAQATLASSAALARERAELLRERSERGGRGAREGEKVESVKTPEWRDGKSLGSESGAGEGDESGEDGDGTNGEDGDKVRLLADIVRCDVPLMSWMLCQPSADLLIELESLDPFRTG
ncbi:uncharacterized protein JCM10292_007602 [Rhodotorula paludigena]|uniref:uncharacterized protein n=1 Tax=Rhodotorula paludigena TaxID=86838 RepID=UPI00317B3643